MEYRKYSNTYYVRMDRGDEIIGNLLSLCRNEGIASCTFSGIGGCGKAELQTYLPETGRFETNVFEGLLELVSLTGSIISDDTNGLFQHTHAVFSFKADGRHEIAAGHVRSIVVSYTAEITLKPVTGGTIKRQYDPETGTGFWKFE